MSMLSASIPVLASLDFDKTAAFYTDQLGFQLRLRTNGTLICERDGCEIHFWHCSEHHIAENTSCYLRGDIEALHADFTRRGLTVDLPLLQPWGMREFYVIDPHGNLLKFGEPA